MTDDDEPSVSAEPGSPVGPGTAGSAGIDDAALADPGEQLLDLRVPVGRQRRNLDALAVAGRRLGLDGLAGDGDRLDLTGLEALDFLDLDLGDALGHGRRGGPGVVVGAGETRHDVVDGPAHADDGAGQLVVGGAAVARSE